MFSGGCCRQRCCCQNLLGWPCFNVGCGCLRSLCCEWRVKFVQMCFDISGNLNNGQNFDSADMAVESAASAANQVQIQKILSNSQLINFVSMYFFLFLFYLIYLTITSCSYSFWIIFVSLIWVLSKQERLTTCFKTCGLNLFHKKHPYK